MTRVVRVRRQPDHHLVGDEALLAGRWNAAATPLRQGTGRVADRLVDGVADAIERAARK